MMLHASITLFSLNPCKANQQACMQVQHKRCHIFLHNIRAIRAYKNDPGKKQKQESKLTEYVRGITRSAGRKLYVNRKKIAKGKKRPLVKL